MLPTSNATREFTPDATYQQLTAHKLEFSPFCLLAVNLSDIDNYITLAHYIKSSANGILSIRSYIIIENSTRSPDHWN